MNRNTESHFAQLPDVDINRSIFDMSHGHTTSFNVGDLIPMFAMEVLPGDTFDVTTSVVARLQTLLTPIMSNVYMDTYYFYVPNRILWTHWKEFLGENTATAWIPQTVYSVPEVSYPVGGWNVGTIADYFGVPTEVVPADDDSRPSALPFRAYAAIANEWFRDQNNTAPVLVSTGDSLTYGDNGSWSDGPGMIEAGGQPFKVAKFHDYFTSALPSPLKADPVTLSFSAIDKYFPTGVMSSDHPEIYTHQAGATLLPMKMAGPQQASNHYLFYNSSISPKAYQADSAANPSHASDLDEHPVNLWTKVEYSSSMTINELRLAFQTQKFYEKNARSGTRYREILREHFGTTLPDYRAMIPEYLGGHRFPLQIHQVANTSQSESSFLGDLGAMSNTADVHGDFIKSFSEHGWLIGVCCVRYDHSYPQGLPKKFSRKSKLDYYFPVFANLGEQPILNREIYLSGSSDTHYNTEAFGYQEAWAEYRYEQNRVSSLMRPSASGSLASWHLADDYSGVPFLSDQWIREDKTNVDRVLAVTSAASNQVFADFWFDVKATRPMPTHSIPGLIDHH